MKPVFNIAFYVVAGALAATHGRRLSTTEGHRHGIG
jgi:hypothetical protein